jgi:hypothetical protein
MLLDNRYMVDEHLYIRYFRFLLGREKDLTIQLRLIIHDVTVAII